MIPRLIGISSEGCLLNEEGSMFELAVGVTITKDGRAFYEDFQKSHNLDKDQLTDMEKDLLALKIKWASVSGVSEV